MTSLRIGMLTPSSNTVLEPVTMQMIKDLPDVTAHFSRFRVTAIGLDAAALSQFDDRPMLAAAELLADAKVDVIVWNGTSAGWLGLDSDRLLCERITRETGIKASTSVLALFDIMRQRKERRIGLATPYTADVQSAIIKSFAEEGIEVICERHQGLRDNFSFSQVPPETITEMVASLASSQPDSIAVFCTNLAGAPLVDTLERVYDTRIHDTVATAIYGAMSMTGYDVRRVSGFGRMFSAA